MQDYKKLSVWKNSHLAAISVYKLTSTFPKEELYGLTSQIRRACISIPTNIAEGCSKDGAELNRYLTISLGSAHELEYLLFLAKELDLIEGEIYKSLNKQVNEIKGMLINLIKKVKS